MRPLAVIALICVTSCSSVDVDPAEQDLGSDLATSDDSTNVEIAPVDSITPLPWPPPEILTDIRVSLDETTVFIPTHLIEQPFSEHNSFRNSEREPQPFIQGHWMHSEGTRNIISFSIDCSSMPILALTDVALLEVPFGVDVEQWMIYHNADFLNDYSSVQPSRSEITSGILRFVSAWYNYETIGPSGESRTIYVAYYQLAAENILFENGAGVLNIATADHTCYPGDGWGISPGGN